MGATSSAFRVLANKPLGPGSFLLTFERNQMQFRAGQYLSLGVPEHREQREYSIYSGENEPHLSVLVKEVEGGLVSRRLARLEPGDLVRVNGPFGYFTLETVAEKKVPLLFLATGTGISPFHSISITNPHLDYTLVHGVRHSDDLALEADFPSHQLISYVSRQPGGSRRGRVTDYLRGRGMPIDTHAFLCGNCDMIYEAFDLLQSSGIPSDQIFTEVYF